MPAHPPRRFMQDRSAAELAVMLVALGMLLGGPSNMVAGRGSHPPSPSIVFPSATSEVLVFPCCSEALNRSRGPAGRVPR